MLVILCPNNFSYFHIFFSDKNFNVIERSHNSDSAGRSNFVHGNYHYAYYVKSRSSHDCKDFEFGYIDIRFDRIWIQVRLVFSNHLILIRCSFCSLAGWFIVKIVSELFLLEMDGVIMRLIQ